MSLSKHFFLSSCCSCISFAALTTHKSDLNGRNGAGAVKFDFSTFFSLVGHGIRLNPGLFGWAGPSSVCLGVSTFNFSSNQIWVALFIDPLLCVPHVLVQHRVQSRSFSVVLSVKRAGSVHLETRRLVLKIARPVCMVLEGT